MSYVRLPLDSADGLGINEKKSLVNILRTRGERVRNYFLSKEVELWKVATVSAIFGGYVVLFVIFVIGRRVTNPFSALPEPSSAHHEVDQAIKLLYHPVLHDYTSDFQTPDGKVFTTTSSAWQSPLGQDLCIINVDTRPMNESNQVWNSDGTFSWRHVTGSQSGYLNHYIYSRIHGYRYIFAQATVPEGWNPGWGRINVLKHHLADCRVMVYADSDVLFPNLRLPFEWLMNHWETPTNRSTISMSLEPDLDWIDKIKDSRGRQGINTGFIFVHNNDSADPGVLSELFTKWAACPSDTDYPGCGAFKKNWPAEQWAFSEWVRYEYEENVRELLAEEAFGWPSWDVVQGPLMRHYTMAKDDMRTGIESGLAEGMMRIVQESMVANKLELFEFEDWPSSLPSSSSSKTDHV